MVKPVRAEIRLPFLAALKPPIGAKTVEEALPEGFTNRTENRGVVEGGWVQQQLILSHPSVGCFVTHCGWGSISEALVNECQLVLMPHVGDQLINARFMGGDLRVGVEVEKGDEDGLFTRDGVVKAMKVVMDGEMLGQPHSTHFRIPPSHEQKGYCRDHCHDWKDLNPNLLRFTLRLSSPEVTKLLSQIFNLDVAQFTLPCNRSLLKQQGLWAPLIAKGKAKKADEKDDEWVTIDEKAHSTIMLCLSDDVIIEVVDQ
ncbi:hypothetical protein SASPL_152338 [Salvia splendens]|uniref:Uncharacterized protein n=1 Tax=Salvia splendens TaxID=180675 RepID=A0A8X8W371_SALSN|nr:hypothetical protein SASPL_152338 [Salvia splendens]